jgi:hypothetical protein
MEAEKAEMEAARRKQRNEELWERLTLPGRWLLAIGVAALAIYALVAFIHWCWRNS